MKYISLTFVSFIILGYIFSLMEVLLSKYLRYGYYVCMNIVVGALYLFMFLQLYHSFKHSQYSISNRMVQVHAILLFIAELFFIIWATLDFPEEFESRYDFNAPYWWKQVSVVFAGIVLLFSM